MTHLSASFENLTLDEAVKQVSFRIHYFDCIEWMLISEKLRDMNIFKFSFESQQFMLQ